MILTAYFDESGVHAGSPVSVMAGFIGDARQWRKFEKRAAKLFNRYRVDIFYAIDIKRSDKDFKDWTVDKKIVFWDEFSHITNETLEAGFSAVLRDDEYHQFYADRQRPAKVLKDLKYGILFRAALSAAVDEVLSVTRWKDGKEPSLNIVLESGHSNAGDTVRLYELWKRNLPHKHPGALSGLTFQSKANCLPLAAADLIAYGTYQLEIGNDILGKSKKPLKADASYRFHVYRVGIDKESLESLYFNSLLDHEEKLAIGKQTKLIS